MDGAVYVSLRYSKYGSPKLLLSEMPAVPGRVLAGWILCRSRVAAEGAFRLRVFGDRSCNRGRRCNCEGYAVLFEKSLETTRDAAQGPIGSAVPFKLELPGNLPGVGDSDDHRTIDWKLFVSAATPGVDYRAKFDLPVFRVADEGLIEVRPAKR